MVISVQHIQAQLEKVEAAVRDEGDQQETATHMVQ